jgi:hypothetical protein
VLLSELPLSEFEEWMEERNCGMEKALSGQPQIREECARQLKELQGIYGRSMGGAACPKELQSLPGGDEK